MRKDVILIIFVFLVLHSRLQGMPNSEVTSKSKNQIVVKKLSATSARITWENFRKQKKFRLSSCPSHYYEVKLKAEQMKENKIWRVNSSQRSIIIKDLPVGGTSSIKVASYMCPGTSFSATRWYKIRMEATKKEIIKPPASMSALSYVNNIFIKWIPPEGRSKIEGYIISYGEEVPDIFFKHVPAAQLNITLSNLKHSSRYVVGVRTFRKLHKSQALYKVLNTQDKSAFGLQPPNIESSMIPSPTNLRLKTLSAKSVLLQWNDPSLFEDQTILDERFYGVHYSKVIGEKNASVLVKSLQVTIYGLEPNQWYKFKVRTVKGVVISPFTEEILGKTLKKDSNIIRKLSNFEEPNVDNFGTIKNILDHEGTALNSFVTPEIKTKRHQKSPKQIYNVSSNLFQDQSEFSSGLRFYHQIQIKVKALITWPKFFSESLCDNETISYLFRFKLASEPDEKYIDSNLTFNFKLLENLDPYKSYKYQVKYFPNEGQELPWSQESILIT